MNKGRHVADDESIFEGLMDEDNGAGGSSDIAVNPATALHCVLNRMLAVRGDTIYNGWTAVLGAQIGEVEFVQRHAEVVGLVAKVTERLHVLPAGNRTRDRYLSYVPLWYQAVVSPEQWTAMQAHHVIDVSALHQLESLSEWIDLADRPPILTDDAVAQLRDALGEWRSLLDEAGLPDGLANEIRSQVGHIDWMLANIGLVGTQAVVDSTRQLAGTGIDAMAARPSMAKRIGVAVAATVAILASVNQGVEETQAILEGVREMAATVQDIEASGFAKPKELAAVPTPPTDEVVDAELVDDEQAG